MNNYKFKNKRTSVDHDNNCENLTSSIQNQVIAAFICNFGAFTSGTAIGWSSPALPKLKSSGFLTETEAAWTGGLYALGGLFSVPLFGYVANTKGRKPTAYLVGIPLLLGFALKAWGSSSYWLLLARFFCGLGGGAATALPPLYIGEIAEPRARGLLSSLLMAENSMGLLFAYILGTLLPDIDLLPITLLPLPLIFLLAFWFMPETPIYRLRCGHEEKAARALAWLRKLPLNSTEIKAELTQLAARLGLKLPLPPLPIKRPRRMSRRRPTPIYMRASSTTSTNSQKEKASFEMEKLKNMKTPPIIKAKKEKSTMTVFKELVSSRTGRRGLSICFALVMAQTFSGLFAVAMYAVYIFETAGTALSPNVCAIVYGSIVVFGSISSSLLIDKTGRRILQIVSSLIICVCHLALGATLQAVANGKNGGFISWLPLIALPACVYSFNVGVGNVPFVILSEIFASEVQDVANTIVMVFMWITLFLLIQFFPICANMIGLYNVFYVFAFVSLLSAGYAYFFLIETKGKSLEDILRELSGEKVQDASKNEKDANNELLPV